MIEDVRVNFYLAKDGEEARRICGFATDKFAEWIKLFQYCKQFNVEFYVRQDDENIPEYIRQEMNMGALIIDFDVSFGTDDCIQCIEVYLQ